MDKILQSGTGFGYYKVRPLVLHSGTGCIITKWDNFITECDGYYKVALNTFLKKLDGKGWIVEEIVTENGTVRIFKAFCQGKNNTGLKDLFSTFFLTQVQVELE